MEYSLSANIFDGSGGNRHASVEELKLLVDGDTDSAGITLSSGNIINIVCDLRNRFNISSIKYYYSGSGSVSISISETYGTWVAVPTTSFIGGVCSFSSGYFPQQVSITHNVPSGTSNIFEIEIYNEDQNILFGSGGTFDSYGIDTTGEHKTIVDIYNNTNTEKDICIFVDSVDDSVEDLIRLSLVESGPYVAKRAFGLCFPNNFSWDSGQHINTCTDTNGYLSLSSPSISGTYYSPVFYVGLYKDIRFYWNSYSASAGDIDYSGYVDGRNCLGLRYHFFPPSGTWHDGSLAETYDSYWSTTVGSLEFNPIPNDTIIELRNYSYMQFMLTVTGTPGNYPYVTRVGIEAPLTVSGVMGNSYKSIYVSTISGTASGKTTNLLCWYKE